MLLVRDSQFIGSRPSNDRVPWGAWIPIVDLGLRRVTYNHAELLQSVATWQYDAHARPGRDGQRPQEHSRGARIGRSSELLVVGEHRSRRGV